MSQRSGRRAGETDTRAGILAAALRLFTADGYSRTSLRAIAREAGVDPALVHHYFDGKPDLFTKAVGLPFRADGVLPQLIEGPREELGQRIAQLYLEVWEGPEADRMVGVLRSALTHDDAARMLREFLTSALLDGVAASLDIDNPRLRAGLVASQIVGLGMLRRVLGFEPLTSAPAAEIAAWLAQTLQAYLTGPAPTDVVARRDPTAPSPRPAEPPR